MLAWLKRRFRRPRVVTVTEVAAPRAHRPSPESAFMPPVPEPVDDDALRAAAREALRTELRDRLATRADRIATRVRGESYAQDVRALLDRVVRSEESSIRPIPTAAKRAMSLARDPLANLQDVAEAFERDPSLAEGLLKLANSAWYRVSDTTVESLREALHRTGSAGAESVILRHTLQWTLCRPGGACEAMTAQVWLHLTRTAALSRALAPAFGLEPESAYLLGLLHDSGKLVLFDAVSEHRRRARGATALPYPILRHMLRDLHEPLGGLAMLRWGLEPGSCAAVADHHRSDPAQRVNAASELLFVAERADLAFAHARPCDPAAWIAEGGLVMSEDTLRNVLTRAGEGALRFVPANHETTLVGTP